MGKLEKYSSYKDSGVDWLGEIPEHWEVRRLASLGSFSKGGGISRDKLVENGLPAILYGDIYTKYNYQTVETKNFISMETSLKAIKIIENDILLTGSGETKEDIGKCIVFKGNEAFAGGDIIIFKQSESNSTFLSYSLNSSYSIMQKMIMAKGEIIVHIYGSALKELLLSLPPREEQTKIASFLDEKVAQIDEVISQKEKLIEFLKERKQIVINDAVTKGLDKDVEFVDSGVEWIGKIPKHWKLERLGSNFIERREKVSDKDFEPLSVTKNGVVPQLDSAAKSNDGDNRKLVRKGDFVINSRSDRKGSSGLSKLDGSVSLINIVLQPININSDFSHILLKSNGFIEEFYRNGHGIVADLWTTRFWDMKSIMLAIPPKNEQLQIVEYIENQTTKIDKAIELQQNYISKLKEYKASLIDSVVTGKVKV